MAAVASASHSRQEKSKNGNPQIPSKRLTEPQQVPLGHTDAFLNQSRALAMQCADWPSQGHVVSRLHGAGAERPSSTDWKRQRGIPRCQAEEEEGDAGKASTYTSVSSFLLCRRPLFHGSELPALTSGEVGGALIPLAESPYSEEPFPPRSTRLVRHELINSQSESLPIRFFPNSDESLPAQTLTSAYSINPLLVTCCHCHLHCFPSTRQPASPGPRVSLV